LAVEFRLQEPLGNVAPYRTRWCGGLRPAQPRIVTTWLTGNGKHSRVTIYLHDGDADVGAPADRIKRDVAGVAKTSAVTVRFGSRATDRGVGV
jgi:hypothetical protein